MMVMERFVSVSTDITLKEGRSPTHTSRGQGNASARAALSSQSNKSINSPLRQSIFHNPAPTTAVVPLTLFCRGVPVMSSFDAAEKFRKASYSWLSEFFSLCA